MRTLLNILPYAGLVLTTFSTIWGLTHELYTKNENNERSLTRAGRYSIAFALLGLFVSLNTAVLKTVIDNQEKAEVKAAEDERKQAASFEQLEAKARAQELSEQQRKTQEILAQKDKEQEKRDLLLATQQIEGFSKTESLTRKQMFVEVQRAAQSAEQARIIIGDLDRSLHPLFPVQIHATFRADLRSPLYANYRERLVKAAPIDDDSIWPELAEGTRLFPNRGSEVNAYNLLMAPPQMRVWFIQNPVAPESYEKQEPNVFVMLKNSAADPPVAVGQRAIIRPKINREYSFSREGIVSIRFPTETINTPDYSDGHILSTLDLLGARMAIEVSSWFTLNSVSIELPGGREIQFQQKDFEHIPGGRQNVLLFTFPKTKEAFAKLILP